MLRLSKEYTGYFLSIISKRNSPANSTFRKLVQIIWDTSPGYFVTLSKKKKKKKSIYIYIYIYTHSTVFYLDILSCVRFFSTLWIVACQVLPSMGFSKQECWSGLPCPPPGYLPNPGIKSASLALAGEFFTPLSHQGNPLFWWEFLKPWFTNSVEM